MKEVETIEVHTKPAYKVQVGSGLLEQCGEKLAEILEPCKIAVITDSNVAPLYLGTVVQQLRKAGFQTVSFQFPAGEQNKNIETYSTILETLAMAHLTRKDCIAALGGGVTGDMAGFAAATFLRGIRYVQMPTSLLAAVDSSVGGKTAIDLRAGKNLAGAFLQPTAVLCDTACLKTLTPEFFADGTAEAIKTGVLSDAALFSVFEEDGWQEHPESVIARCVAYKAGVVERDEKEQGERKLLNLGHTVGHAIEKCSDYLIPHGHAVAAGMAIMARAAEKLGWTAEPVADRISACLAKNHLPIDTIIPPELLARAALGDKKRSGDRLTLIVPEKIGKCVLREIPVGELLSVIEAGWEV